MTDIKDHLASALGDEPPMVDDLDAVVSTGRQPRRHTGWLAVAGTAGAAALATAVIVPIVATEHGGSTPAKLVTVSTPKPTAAAAKCKSFIYAAKLHGSPKLKDLKKAYQQLGNGPHHVVFLNKKQGKQLYEVTNCAHGIPGNATTNSGPTGPKYHYTEAPAAIASRLATKLAADASTRHLTVVYSRPFAQESSSLEKGHPTYYDGNVDVQVGSTLGDIGVQVNHPTTTQQPFTGKCDGTGFAQCQRTTLADGAVLQTDRVKVGHGTFIIEAQESRPDGTLVQVQESNYAFGPEAGKSHGNQPLPLSALISMAEDSGYSF